MGQPVRVAEKRSAVRPGVVRYETNRPLTGMGHEHFDSAADATDPEDPAHELARRLFARGGIDHVHVYGSVVTVDLAKGADTTGVLDIIANLFKHY